MAGSTSKQLSIAGMIGMTLFLVSMDLRDLYFKIYMCGTHPTFWFVLDAPEVVTNYDITKAIHDAHGVWLSPTNMWNALALECDAFFPSKLAKKKAHLSSMGINCTLDGVKHYDERMFIGSHRIDAFMWATGILADVVDQPLVGAPPTNAAYASFFNLDEQRYHTELSAMVTKADIPTIKADVQRVVDTFGARTGLWHTVLCYESAVYVPPGHTALDVRPVEHGCIWRSMETNETVKFHIGPTTGKYYRALCDMMGLQWHTRDYLSFGSGIFLRARKLQKTSYDMEHLITGERHFRNLNETDLGFDGVLYFVLILLELVIFSINATDCATVAMNVVRPLLARSIGSTYMSGDTKISTFNTTASKFESRSIQASTVEKSSKVNEEKVNTLSKMLLYTDLTSIAYRKPLLATLVVLDTVLAWLYIVPNSNAFAWATNPIALGSAYLSTFRVWVLVLITIDRVWRWVLVPLHEKTAALVTELTYITSFEIMCATLVGVYLSFTDIMNICVLKYGLVDGQRKFTPSSPTIKSFYNGYTRYTWGDRSFDHDSLHYIYYPLAKIVQYGVFFSSLVLVVRLALTVAWRYHKGTLGGEVESFWRSYQRNSAEVFMNQPLRANALIRSQSLMSYRFGKAVFIRPFVYLEQNYYITRGKFRQRPEVPFLQNEDADSGADVDTQSYMIAGVYRDEQSSRLQKKLRGQDVQIPLC